MKVHHVFADPEEEIREVPFDPEKETREEPLDPEEETREVPSDPKEETREVPLDLEEKTREVRLDPEEGTSKAPLNPAEETLEHHRIPRRRHGRCRRTKKRKQKIQHGRPSWKGRSYSRVRSSPSAVVSRQIVPRRTWSRRVHAGVEEAVPQRSLPTNEEGDEESVSMCDGGGTMIFQRKVELPEPIARGMSQEQ